MPASRRCGAHAASPISSAVSGGLNNANDARCQPQCADHLARWIDQVQVRFSLKAAFGCKGQIRQVLAMRLSWFSMFQSSSRIRVRKCRTHGRNAETYTPVRQILYAPARESRSPGIAISSGLTRSVCTLRSFTGAKALPDQVNLAANGGGPSTAGSSCRDSAISVSVRAARSLREDSAVRRPSWKSPPVR